MFIPKKRALFVSTILAAAGTAAFAQSADAAKTEKPAYSGGGDFRLRFEAYNNVQTLGTETWHNREYFRARMRIWETVNLTDEITFFGRLAAEPRYWFNGSKAQFEDKWEGKYVAIDNIYAKWATKCDCGSWALTVGRQDIVFGDGWLVTDGTPIDGSFTNSFDAARITLDVKDIKTKFDIIGIDNRALVDGRLPVLGHRKDPSGSVYTNQEQNEQGVIVYASNKSIKNLQVDGYLIYKDDDIVTSAPKGYNGQTYTTGIRLVGTPEAHWLYSAEGAYQWGRRNRATALDFRDVSAYAFNGKLTYMLKDSMNNQFSFVTEYLSGDKLGDSTDGMFDVLWGRTPRISEVWSATYSTETGRNLQYNNLFRIGGSWSIQPWKGGSITTTYNALFAPVDGPTRNASSANALFTRDSGFRGHLFSVVLKHKFSDHLSGLILGEACPMGDYYKNDDLMTFLRTEILYSF
jgi:hypothetical protein